LTVYFSQGSVATDLRGGASFHSTFLHRSVLEFNSEKIMKLVHVSFAEVIVAHLLV